jgi:hypothetical protein
MTDAQLVNFGKAARSLCRDPKCPEVFKRQLEEAKTEWRRSTRKLSDIMCQAQARGGQLPRLTFEHLTQIARDGCAPSQDLPSHTFNHFSHFAVSSFFEQCTGGKILVNCPE